jgi:hypothetical protein
VAERFKDTPEECQHLRDTHLKGFDTLPFSSYTIAGDVDDPVRLDLFANQRPAHNEYPISVFNREGDTLVLEPRMDRKKYVRPVEEVVEEAPPAAPVSKGPMVFVDPDKA